MSITTEPPHPRGVPAAAGGESDTACSHCGAQLERDQEWCLECGGAQTLIHAPPDWRVPFAIVGTVVLLVAAGFAIALINLSGSANRLTSTQTVTVTAAAGAPAAPARTIAAWPVGLGGWTVMLARTRTEATANAIALQQPASVGDVGVLDSSQHPSMAPGYWVVFSGRYPSRELAAAAAARLQALGLSAAGPRRVAQPGGL